jgi:hypothetical protein
VGRPHPGRVLGDAPGPKKRRVPDDREPERDDWRPIIRALVKRGVDPTQFPDMTYPMIMCILTDDDQDKEETMASRAKRVMKDFKGGKYRTG